jgi:hypothetical protein
MKHVAASFSSYWALNKEGTKDNITWCPCKQTLRAGDMQIDPTLVIVRTDLRGG